MEELHIIVREESKKEVEPSETQIYTHPKDEGS